MYMEWNEAKQIAKWRAGLKSERHMLKLPPIPHMTFVDGVAPMSRERLMSTDTPMKGAIDPWWVRKVRSM